jgi:hypothetical protein
MLGNIFDMSGKIWGGGNISVKFACSGKLYCAPPNQTMPVRPYMTVFASVGSANKMNKLSLVGMQLPENIWRISTFWAKVLCLELLAEEVLATTC